MKKLNRKTLHVAISFAAFLMIGANDGALGVILPSISTHYHVDHATVGLLFFASTIGYFIASFASGPLAVGLGTRNFLLLASLIFLLATGILSLAPPFVLLLVAALLLGSGIALIDAGLNAYIAGLPHNTALLNYLHAFYGAGAWLGPVVASGLLALQFTWNNVYLVWGGMSLLLLFSIAPVFESRTPAQAREAKQEGNLLAITLRHRAVWLAAFFLLVYVGSEVSLGNWSYSFLTEERRGAALISGWMVSGYWFGLTLGRLVLGRVGQAIGNRQLIQICLGGVVAGLLLVWLFPQQPVEALGLWLTGFCLGPLFPTTIALMSTLVSSRILPGAVGFMTSLGSMGGALFPWLAGNLAQHIGLWSLLPYIIALSAVMLAIWGLLQRQPRVNC
ncbi:MAG: MFS transporter [Ktedonobacteraceae bacterium]|nr:MFS transporter [Ktedonobacteraceae bacterium]